MNPFFRLTRYFYEEPHFLNLFVAASNGRVQGELEIYCNAKDLGVVARQLRAFPFSGSRDAVLWELGSERPEDRFAFYFRLRAVRVSALGRCAIEMRTNNNRSPPDREISEFSIEALPA